MIGDRPLRPDRTRKARSDAACCLCGAAVMVGTRIGRIEIAAGRHGWAHMDCISARRQAAASQDVPASRGAAPKETP